MKAGVVNVKELLEAAKILVAQEAKEAKRDDAMEELKSRLMGIATLEQELKEEKEELEAFLEQEI